jgi:hypothetical protein
VIPKSLLICLDTALKSEEGQIYLNLMERLGLEEDAVLILFVLHQRFVKSAESFWAPYFQSLPSFSSFPLMFSFSELMELQSSPLLELIISDKEHVAEVHSMVRITLSSRSLFSFSSFLFQSLFLSNASSNNRV